MLSFIGGVSTRILLTLTVLIIIACVIPDDKDYEERNKNRDKKYDD